MAFPFMPMTDEMLKKLTRMMQDSNQTINSHDLHSEFASQAFNTVLELIPPATETNQSNLLTSNR